MPATLSRLLLGPLMVLLFASSLQGCGGGGGSDAAMPTSSSAGDVTMVRMQAEAAGLNCPNGGSQVLAGVDANGNGVLDAGEVASTQYVCVNGSGGAIRSTLVALASEPAGTNCATGGTTVSAGLDANANGLLDSAEVASTTYVCGGTPGAAGASGTNGLDTLMAMSAEAAGANCTWGGSRVTAGLDANRSGTLDAGEVSSTQYLCNGAPGPGVVWLTTNDPVQQTVGNIGYIAQGAAQTVFTLPVSPAIGDVVRIVGAGSGGWQLAQNAGQSIVTSSIGSTLAGALWTPRATPQAWRAVASSSDGGRVVAVVNGGYIYTSTDAGASWTPRDAQRVWWAVASSADGTRLAATTFGGQLYTSDDAGLTWNARDAARLWAGIAMSSDGSRMVATDYGGGAYTSPDGGINWTAVASTADWTGVASSADGLTLAALAFNGQIHVSTDGGASWNMRDMARAWIAIAMSADGRRMVAAEQGGLLYTSGDAGATWTPHGTANGWSGVASSADGRRLIASAFSGQLFASNDGGATWTARETIRDWNGVASSSDGMHIVAVAYNGGLAYTSTASTSLGSAGSISGLQDDALDLQYLGSGRFLATGHVGALTVQ